MAQRSPNYPCLIGPFGLDAAFRTLTEPATTVFTPMTSLNLDAKFFDGLPDQEFDLNLCDLFGFCAFTQISLTGDLGARDGPFKGYIESITVSAAVPLPASFLLPGAGLGGLGALRRMRRKS